MATGIQVVFDCADPGLVARFWVEALHYKIQDPPSGFASWHEFLKAQGIREEKWNDASAIVDPDERGPRIYFQRVPEGKVVKNRVHLDLNVSGGRDVSPDEKRRRVDAEVERLVAAGATVMRPGSVGEFDEYWAVLQDVEGNEFCVQ